MIFKKTDLFPPFLAVTLWLGHFSLASAAEREKVAPASEQRTPQAEIAPETFWQRLWGIPVMNPTLQLGMWSYHLKHEPDNMQNGNNQLIGVAYHGYFAATLVNSQYKRAYAVGVQRYWLTQPLSNHVSYQLGYRLGLISGYDKKFGRAAEISPILPFPQLISDLTWRNVGWEVSYTWVVVSTSFYIRF